MPTPASHTAPITCLGACSWSLRPDSPGELTAALTACGISTIQLALEPLRTHAWRLDDTSEALRAADIRIASAMMSMHAEDYSTLQSIHTTGGLRPDAAWPINRAAGVENARIAAALGVSLMTFHAGFLPDDPASPLGATMLSRLREFASIFANEHIQVALETGQEPARTLLRYLDELRDLKVGVNFDPANMILYASGDPVTALEELLPFVAQVHIKDAVNTRTPGTWGEEVRVGSGEVDWPAFFTTLARAPKPIPAMIEREAGETRAEDIRHAAAFVSQMIRVP